MIEMSMLNMIIVGESLFFFVMGLVALIKPSFVTCVFREPTIAADMRNEVRAVYGGFGLAMCLALALTLYLDELRAGILFTVSIALLGMAFGRLVSFFIESVDGKNPAIFLLVEIVLGSGLLYAWSITAV